jgi:aminoglycoside phosphotransferase (APT) family kinase protein
MQNDSSGFIATTRVDQGGNCQVWAGKLPDGTPAFLKKYPQPRSWLQEKQALEKWLPDLSSTWPSLPRMLHHDENARTLVTSTVPGLSVERNWPGLSQMNQVMQQAGKFLCALHRIHHNDSDPMPLNDALPLRLETWISNHQNSLTDREINIAREKVGDGSLFDHDNRVCCHNDYQPRNWLWDGKRFGIIDFEHSNYNHPAFDWVRLETGIWQKHPEMRDRFIEGYGTEPGWSHGAALEAICAIYAVGSIVWGSTHDAVALVADGRRILD